MKSLTSLACTAALGLAFSMTALADEPGKPAPVQPAPSGNTPAMSEIPKMKEQGERMATLMEKLTKETDPAERKRIMAEAVCPQ
ncbi:MAG: hypothetical protein RL404_1892 [Pseudomonadota bacterium]